MKRKLLASLLLLAPVAHAKLEVHEWGTFTTLAGSDGGLLNWYLPSSDISALPRFVERNPMASKLALLGRMRMETPVIYFYPDKPMSVTVKAKLEQGHITEVYPRPVNLLVAGVTGGPVTWQGDLLRPHSPEALALIPQVSSDERGAHYAAAREVPDAWIFRHRFEQTDPETKTTRVHEQADKFIFYRGVGQTGPTLGARENGTGQVSFTNTSPWPFPTGVVLEVRGEKARWAVMPEVPSPEKAGSTVKESSTLPDSWQPVEQTGAELTAWFHRILTDEGLTPAEAKAMVTTWHGSWFREPGLRAFNLMPRKWIDEILPLQIEPKPEKLVRVFVARFELLTRDQENGLADLLLDASVAGDQARTTLNQLELGRFEQAAVQRATAIAAQRMTDRYHTLKAPPATSMR